MADRTEEFEGPNWRDNPLENTPMVRRSHGFLKSRGYQNPELARLKLCLVEKIRETVEDKNWKQSDVVRHVTLFDPNEFIDQPDVSRILNANLDRFSLDRLIIILAALDNRVSLKSKPVAKGRGCIVVETA